MKNYESLNSINRICYSIMRILDTGKKFFSGVCSGPDCPIHKIIISV